MINENYFNFIDEMLSENRVVIMYKVNGEIKASISDPYTDAQLKEGMTKEMEPPMMNIPYILKPR